MDPITLSLLFALGSAAAGGAAAIAQNRAVSASMASTRRAAEVQSRQTSAQARQEGIELRRRTERIRGAILARDSADVQTLLGAADADLSYNLAVLRANEFNALAAIFSGREAAVTDLAGRRRSPLLDAFAGELSGAATGLSIQAGLDGLRAASRPPIPDATLSRGFVGPIP